jgi:hypothetical protein
MLKIFELSFTEVCTHPEVNRSKGNYKECNQSADVFSNGNQATTKPEQTAQQRLSYLKAIYRGTMAVLFSWWVTMNQINVKSFSFPYLYVLFGGRAPYPALLEQSTIRNTDS